MDNVDVFIINGKVKRWKYRFVNIAYSFLQPYHNVMARYEKSMYGENAAWYA